VAQATLGEHTLADVIEQRRSPTGEGHADRWELLGRCRRDRTVVAGALIVGIIAAAAVAAPWVAPHDPTAVDSRAILAPPSAEHWLGTDNLGRDIFSRLVYGARWSLGAAASAAAAIVLVGITVGVIAGYVGGLVDDLLAFPSLVLALAIVGTLGPSLQNVMIGMVAIWWVDYARVMRGLTLGVRDREYVIAAQCAGASSPWVILRHVLPNVIPSVLVLATLELGGLILAISGLSFLGLGAQPPTPEWGTMLNDGRPFFQRAPQLMIYPGLAITLVVVGCNLLGDGLRDVLDPRLKR
jgi:ABC-type dipeptide/oligopeptide/nickel transport system permease subunit